MHRHRKVQQINVITQTLPGRQQQQQRNYGHKVYTESFTVARTHADMHRIRKIGKSETPEDRELASKRENTIGKSIC